MPTPSYKELRKQNSELMKRVRILSTDVNYNVTTRPAIEFELRDLKKNGESPRYVVFLDVDDCHGANIRYGYEAVNGKIKRACNVRSSDVLIRARWFSGDELVFLLKGDPEGFIARLRTAFRNNDLGISIAHTVYTGDLEADVRMCAAVVQAQKNGYPA